MLLQSYIIIFHVIYCVKPCVNGSSGASNPGLGGWGWVGFVPGGFDQPASPYSI